MAQYCLKTCGGGRDGAFFLRATKHRFHHLRPIPKTVPALPPAPGCFGALVVPPHWPPWSPASERQSDLRACSSPFSRPSRCGGAPRGYRHYNSQKALRRGVTITEDSGGGASWDEAGARSTGISVATAWKGRVFSTRNRRLDPWSRRFTALGHCLLPSSSRRPAVPQPGAAEATAAAEVTMSPGFLRAVAGQGAAAAVQLLVTLGFLSSLVKTQVSPRDQRQGTGRAGVAKRPRCRCEWPARD